MQADSSVVLVFVFVIPTCTACGACGRAFSARPKTLWETRSWRFPQVWRDPQALRVEGDRMSGSRSDDLRSPDTAASPWITHARHPTPRHRRLARVAAADSSCRSSGRSSAWARKRSRIAVAAGTSPRKTAPVLRRPIRGDQCRRRFVTTDEDLEEVLGRSRRRASSCRSLRGRAGRRA